MSSEKDQQDPPSQAGPSTAQHITGAPETGTFTTDLPPSGNTPADGSSNAGINANGGNRVEGDDEV
jgi:hypothetical protein